MAADEIRLDLRHLDSLIAALDGRAERLVVELAAEAANRTKQKAPVRTGNLRRSYHYELDPSDPQRLTAIVGTDVAYAPYVEFGTRKMAPRPHLLPAFEEVRALAPRRAAELFRVPGA
jgi:HK97 gp10 family phage protein